MSDAAAVGQQQTGQLILRAYGGILQEVGDTYCAAFPRGGAGTPKAVRPWLAQLWAVHERRTVSGPLAAGERRFSRSHGLVCYRQGHEQPLRRQIWLTATVAPLHGLNRVQRLDVAGAVAFERTGGETRIGTAGARGIDVERGVRAVVPVGGQPRRMHTQCGCQGLAPFRARSRPPGSPVVDLMLPDVQRPAERDRRGLGGGLQQPQTAR